MGKIVRQGKSPPLEVSGWSILQLDRSKIMREKGPLLVTRSNGGGISAPPLPDRTLKEPDIRPVEPIQRPGLHKGTITQRSAPG